jgi:hypothetical protein
MCTHLVLAAQVFSIVFQDKNVHTVVVVVVPHGVQVLILLAPAARA